jgi:hypothetical protein
MFLIHKMDTTLTRGIEYIPKEGAGSGAVGMLLKPAGDYYVTASGEDIPTHLAVGITNEADIIPAIRLDSQIELENVTEADLTAVSLGAMLKTDGDTVIAENGGRAQLTYKEKCEDGKWICRVRFI